MRMSFMPRLFWQQTVFCDHSLVRRSRCSRHVSLPLINLPFFTHLSISDMYRNLGIHWASSIPAFLALACVPFPFLFYKYGEPIRLKCKYAAQAAAALEQMKGGGNKDNKDDRDREDEQIRGEEKEVGESKEL
jgi:hypothetical protein